MWKHHGEPLWRTLSFSLCNLAFHHQDQTYKAAFPTDGFWPFGVKFPQALNPGQTCTADQSRRTQCSDQAFLSSFFSCLTTRASVLVKALTLLKSVHLWSILLEFFFASQTRPEDGQADVGSREVAEVQSQSLFSVSEVWIALPSYWGQYQSVRNALCF